MKKFLAVLCAFTFAFLISVQSLAYGVYEEIEPYSSGKRIRKTELGTTHSSAITVDGDLYVWGYNGSGTVGNGSSEYCVAEPTKVLNNVVDVSLYANNSAAVTADGSLYMWGSNYYGQLGNGEHGIDENEQGRRSLVPIKVLDDVISVAAGNNHTLALKKDGSLYSWGWNDSGELGIGDQSTIVATPTKIMDDVVSIAASGGNSAAITSDGSLYVWGYNEYGEVGNGEHGTYEDGNPKTCGLPVRILSNVASVSLSDLAGAAVTMDGTLYMWGHEVSVQGTGTSITGGVDCYRPAKLMDNVASVDLGCLGTFAAVTKNGDLYMWGDNICGLLLNGESGYGTKPVYVPTKIMGDVVSVSVGGSHASVVTKDGKAYIWGDNNRGQLGDGTVDIGGYYVPIVQKEIIIPLDSDVNFTPGDVNGDKTVTLEDAILALKYAMHVGIGNEVFIEAAADVVGTDGNITLEDAIAILKIAMHVAS